MMKVLTYNVHGWLTPDGGAANVGMLAEVIAATGADVVGLNEVFHPWHASAGPALKDLADSLGMTYAFGPTLPAQPAPTAVPYGNALLSRWPILAYATHHLAPTVSYGRRGLLETRVLLPSGQPFTVYVTHLDHRSEAIRLEQWASANAWLLRDRGRPHLLLGDFNALAVVDYPAPETVSHLKAYQLHKAGRFRHLTWSPKCSRPATWTLLTVSRLRTGSDLALRGAGAADRLHLPARRPG